MTNFQKEALRWKAEHDDVLDKYHKLQESIEGGNPQMIAKLNQAIRLKNKSIDKLHDQIEYADNERDEAMAYAKEMKGKYEQVIKEAKEYEIEYEDRYKNMKAQRDHLAEAYSLLLAVSE